MKRDAIDPRFRIGRNETTSDALSRLGYSHRSVDVDRVRAAGFGFMGGTGMHGFDSAREIINSDGEIVYVGDVWMVNKWIKSGCKAVKSPVEVSS